MTPDRLLDVEPVTHERWTGERLPVLFDGCPHCGDTLVVSEATQGVLFRGCGYGGTKRFRWRICPSCLWWMESGFDTTNPKEW